MKKVYNEYDVYSDLFINPIRVKHFKVPLSVHRIPKFDFETVLNKQNLKNGNKAVKENNLLQRNRQHRYNNDANSRIIGDGDRSAIEDFEASSTLQLSDYASTDEELVIAESSGDEWEQFED